MKTYKITKTTTLHEIEIIAQDDKGLDELFREGVVDEVLSNKNPIEHYIITDAKGNIIREKTYT